MEFLSILKDSIKLLPKNSKLIALIALLSSLLSSSFFILFHHSLLSLSHHMLLTIKKSLRSHPNSFDSTYPISFAPQTVSKQAQVIIDFLGHLREDLALILAVYISCALVISTIAFFSSVSTIIVSAFSYNDKNLSLRGLISRIWTTWRKPFITSLYVSALAFGYFFIVATSVIPLHIYPSRVTDFVHNVIVIKAFVFYLYLLVAWNLAFIVTIVEESCYGFEALEKGAQLVKGKRLHGFLLNICFSLVIFVIFRGCRIVFVSEFANPTLYALFLVSLSFLARIFQGLAYTVFYFHCKKNCTGEQIELKGSFEYTKVPTTTQLANDIP